MSWIFFGIVGAGFGLALWVALLFPFPADNRLNLPTAALRLIILMPLALTGLPAIARADTGWIVAVSAAVSFAFALSWDLAIRHRQRMAAERPAWSDEVLDRIYGRCVRVSVAADELQRTLLRHTMFAVVAAALALAAAYLPGVVIPLAAGAPGGSEVSLLEPLGWFIRVAAVTGPLLVIGVHLVGPLVLGLFEWWVLAGLTSGERTRAEDRAIRVGR